MDANTVGSLIVLLCIAASCVWWGWWGFVVAFVTAFGTAMITRKEGES